MSLLDVTTEIQAALASLRRGQAFITEEIARLEAFLAAGTTTGAAQTPKRRGRPPKASAATVSATPAKRGPGRSRKSATLSSTTTTEVKRGPGRPRKNPAPEATAKNSRTGKRNWTPAQREAARKRMQDYWAKRKKS